MRRAALTLTLCTLGCGGSVVVDPGSGGSGASGTGSTTSSTSSTTGTTTATTTTGDGCTQHSDCPGGGVCVFSAGQCAAPCNGEQCSDCGPGSVCDACATSSCPDCLDCMAACVPPAGRCDDTDPCPAGQACFFPIAECRTVCDNGACPPGQLCHECATGSCCGCENCVSLCELEPP